MFGAATSRRLRGLGVAAIAGVAIFATSVLTTPATAEVDLSVAIPGVTYYTPPPAFSYGSSYWYQPVVGGIYLGFGHYHHHYW